MNKSRYDSTLTDDQLQKAIDGCEAEPIHIPGIVQPFGCLIGINIAAETIAYASANAMSVIGKSGVSLLSKQLSDVFDRDLLHSMRNAAARPDVATSSISLGRFTVNAHQVDAQMFAQGEFHIIEFEPAKNVSFGSDQALNTLTLMIETMQGCSREADLFESTTALLQHISGFDRIMVYKFDPDYNGEVVAEAKQPGLDPYLGLRFPSHDIPAQARAVMEKLPLRLITDVNQIPVPLIAASVDMPDLDITLASTRGVSPVHMQYLRHMDVEATMTLSIIIQDKLWGLISFHHRKPKVPPAGLRQVLKQFIGLFCTKLEALQQDAILRQIKSVDNLKEQLALEVDENRDEHASFAQFFPIITDLMQSSGVTIILDGQTRSYGTVPGKITITALQDNAHDAPGTVVAIHSLAQKMPGLAHDFNGLGGALCCTLSPRSTVIFYRKTIEQQVSWAGQPEKKAETVSGTLRLKPRSSFSVYLQNVSDACAHWTERDMFLASRIWPIIDSEERRALLKTITRQQTIMINELNHRVRNILALVRSVSHQMERREDSSSAYHKTLEKRLEALAMAHDMASNIEVTSVNVFSIIETELAPYMTGDLPRSNITGLQAQIRADIAPIFSLVTHELTTNAVKYGALSVPEGTVQIKIEQNAEGVVIRWIEKNGPPVAAPNQIGFGSTLIKEAVPHELGGRTNLVFDPGGLQAELFFPKHLFEDPNIDQQAPLTPATVAKPQPRSDEDFPQSILSGTALLLEDNYIIAKEMQDQLIDFGFSDVAMLSNVEDTLEFIAKERPAVAVFDVHLGDEKTSIEAALQLILLDIPFVFVTGYGASQSMPEGLAGVPILKKPVETEQLRAALVRIIKDKLDNT